MLKRIEYNPAAAGREKRTEVHFFFFFFFSFLVYCSEIVRRLVVRKGIMLWWLRRKLLSNKAMRFLLIWELLNHKLAIATQCPHRRGHLRGPFMLHSLPTRINRWVVSDWGEICRLRHLTPTWVVGLIWRRNGGCLTPGPCGCRQWGGFARGIFWKACIVGWCGHGRGSVLVWVRGHHIHRQRRSRRGCDVDLHGLCSREDLGGWMCRQAVAITGRGRKQMVHILRGQRCWRSKGVGSDRMQHGRHVCLSTSLGKCREVKGRSLSRRCLPHSSIAGIERLGRLGLPNAMSTAIAWHPRGVWRHGCGCGQH